MKRALATLILLVVTAFMASSVSAGVAETIKLKPTNAAGVKGTATVTSPGDAAAAAVRVEVRGLKPHAPVRIQLNVVEGKHTSASTVLILAARADANGTLTGSGRVHYRGEPVTFATIADGAHAISVLSSGKLVARGIVPGMD